MTTLDMKKPIRLGWLRHDTVIVGRYLIHGYVYVRVRDHPLLGRGSKLVREHRLVMMEKLGRKLPRRIDVHHKKWWLRQFNHPDNLECMDHGKHASDHSLKRSKQHNERLRQSRLGRVMSEKTKLKMSKSQKRRWKKDQRLTRPLHIRKRYRKY